MTANFDRRSFLKRAGSTTLSVAALQMLAPGFFASAETNAGFLSAWPEDASRVWPGPSIGPTHCKTGKFSEAGSSASRLAAIATSRCSRAK